MEPHRLAYPNGAYIAFWPRESYGIVISELKGSTPASGKDNCDGGNSPAINRSGIDGVAQEKKVQIREA